MLNWLPEEIKNETLQSLRDNNYVGVKLQRSYALTLGKQQTPLDLSDPSTCVAAVPAKNIARIIKNVERRGGSIELFEI